MDEESPQGQTSNFGELNSENDKRIRERVRYNNLSPLAKQHRISMIAEARVNRNRNTIHEGEGTLIMPWFMWSYFCMDVTLNTCLLNVIAGLHETGQTCVTQTCNVPVTRGIVIWNFLNCVLTYVNHCDVLTPVYCLIAARNNEQYNRVHFDSGIWEPNNPDQTDEGSIISLKTVMNGTLNLKTTIDFN